MILTVYCQLNQKLTICIESPRKVGKCKEFTFGGCEGNGNRYAAPLKIIGNQ